MDVSKFRSMVLVIGLAGAAVLVVVLASQKRDLLVRIESLTTRIRDPYVGMYVPAATLPSVTGGSILLGEAPAGHVQVLFVFSTGCSYCKASLPAWKRIVQESSDDSQVAVVGISLDSVEATRDYVAEHGLEFPVVNFTEPKLRMLYRTVLLPQSIVLDHKGVVQYSRLGALTESTTMDSVLIVARSLVAVGSQGELK
jgi:peroxiredoxin